MCILGTPKSGNDLPFPRPMRSGSFSVVGFSSYYGFAYLDELISPIFRLCMIPTFCLVLGHARFGIKVSLNI